MPAYEDLTRDASGAAETPHLNGQDNGQAPPKKPRKKREKTTPASELTVEECRKEALAELRKGIKTYSKRDARKAKWFLHPYIPRGIYVLLAGKQGTGKTTFLMHLVSKAKRALILPGEEPIPQVVLPRLNAIGVSPSKHIILPPDDRLLLPKNADALTDLVRVEGIDLIVGDPVSAYFDHNLNHKDDKDVRRALGAFLRATSENNAAAGLVQHSGKQEGNHVADSRAFLNHARGILLFVVEATIRDRGQLQVLKAPFGVYTPPHYYELKGDDGEPKSFVLKGEVEPSKALEALELPDRYTRTLLDHGTTIVESMLKDATRVSAKDTAKRFEEEGIGKRHVYRVFDRLGLRPKTVIEEKQRRTYWSHPKK